MQCTCVFFFFVGGMLYEVHAHTYANSKNHKLHSSYARWTSNAYLVRNEPFFFLLLLLLNHEQRPQHARASGDNIYIKARRHTSLQTRLVFMIYSTLCCPVHADAPFPAPSPLPPPPPLSLSFPPSPASAPQLAERRLLAGRQLPEKRFLSAMT